VNPRLFERGFFPLLCAAVVRGGAGRWIGGGETSTLKTELSNEDSVGRELILEK
jgi:hypothetical protein